MISLSELWLPILLSAVIVFLVSSVIHMLTPWHKGDFSAVPNEDRAREALRSLAIPPGDYMIPRAGSMQDMKNPAFVEKMRTGPKLMMTVLPPGDVSMRKPLIGWFLFSLVVGLFAAYIASRALPPGADYASVFRFAGTTAFVGYTLATWPESIWFGRSWKTTVKGTIDGLLYGLLTGGTFGWLWPQ